MCPDGEVTITQNNKNLLKDLAVVNPWDSKPAPVVTEPALILPGGVENSLLLPARPRLHCVHMGLVVVIQRARSASHNTE